MRTIDQIINSIKLELSSQNSKLSNFNGFSNFYLICRTIAKSLLEVEAYVEEQDAKGFIDNLEGADLDIKANELGLFRKINGSRVRGTVLVSSNFQFVLPTNVILTEPNTGIQFKTLGTNTINGLNIPIAVEALIAQPIDLAAGTVLNSSIYSDLSFVIGKSMNMITNEIVGDIIGGTAAETDEELRLRILQRLSNQSAATADNIRSSILDLEGITQVFISSNDPIVGYLTIYIDTNDTSVLNNVRRVIESNRAAGINYLIKPIRYIPIDVAVDLVVTSNASLNQIETNVRFAINDYIRSLSLGRILRVSELINRIYSVNNVIEVNVTQPDDDVAILSNNLFKLNNIKVTLTKR